MAIPHEAEYRPNDEDPEVLRTFTSSRMGGGKNASSGPMKVSYCLHDSQYCLN